MRVVSCSKGCQKSRKIVKEPEKLQRYEKFAKPPVQRNIYRSTDPPSIRYKELENSDSFSSSFLLGSEAFSIPRLE